MAEQLALPTSDPGVAGSNPAGGEILPEPKRRFIAESLSSSSFHRPEMTEILLKGRKTLTHPSTKYRTLTHIYKIHKIYVGQCPIFCGPIILPFCLKVNCYFLLF